MSAWAPSTTKRVLLLLLPLAFAAASLVAVGKILSVAHDLEDHSYADFEPRNTNAAGVTEFNLPDGFEAVAAPQSLQSR
jgi:hypothetical protein